MLGRKRLALLSQNLVAEPDNYMHSLRKNLDMYIAEKDITLVSLSEMADIPVSTLRSLVYGDASDCRVSTIVALAKALKVSVDELLGSGTISRGTCHSMQTIRLLPESFAYFLRWATKFHYEMLTAQKVSQKAVEIMLPRCENNGNMRMTTEYEILDISDLDMEILPKVFMGIKIPCNHYAPHYFKGDILLIANDRVALRNELVLVAVKSNMWVVRKKGDMYYSIRDGRTLTEEKNRISQTIGYVVKVIRKEPEDE